MDARFKQLKGKIEATDADLKGKIASVEAADTALQGKIDTKYTALEGKIDTKYTELQGKIDAGQVSELKKNLSFAISNYNTLVEGNYSTCNLRKYILQMIDVIDLMYNNVKASSARKEFLFQCPSLKKSGNQISEFFR